MKILVLCKRRYMGKDLLDDRFGRMWEIPQWLAASGHEVHGITLSYGMLWGGGQPASDKPPLGVDWQAHSAFRPVRWAAAIEGAIRDHRPDVIWAGLDAPHVVVGQRLAARAGAPIVADLYDNYESYPATRWVPGLLWQYRKSLKRVQGITCISDLLRSKLQTELEVCADVAVVENGVDPDVFFPRGREQARRELGVPRDAILVGTAGALTRDRGIWVLPAACDRLRELGVPVHLVVAGPRDRGFRAPRLAPMIDLGAIAQEQIPLLLSALDVGVIANRDSAFGQFCFPMKLYEMVACRVPLVAAQTGVCADLLKAQPHCLFRPECVDSLVSAIQSQLRLRVQADVAVAGWSTLAGRVERLLQRVVSGHAGSVITSK